MSLKKCASDEILIEILGQKKIGVRLGFNKGDISFLCAKIYVKYLKIWIVASLPTLRLELINFHYFVMDTDSALKVQVGYGEI